MKVLVDTGPLVALADPLDRDHLACKNFVRDHRGPLLTTWPVLTEFSHMSGSIRIALPLFRWIENGGIELLPMGIDELAVATDWMERYADRPMDLADASLVVAALTTGVTTVWTLDRNDFETYRLPNRKRFRLVEMT
jgi:predicted nucleic acid-binding protein